MFGTVVVGPPGSGKSTMCAGLARYLELMKRPCAVVNLDPACEAEPLTPFTIDVRNLCRVDDVMRTQGLGANGSLMYCVATMRESPWLVDRLRGLGTDEFPYVVFDLPGQVELWTHSDDLRQILTSIVDEFDARLVVAHVVDANHCTRPTSFVAAALISLMAMLRLELPHVNVLSKIDQLPSFKDSMPFNLDFFADARQLDRLVPYCDATTNNVPALGELEVPKDDDRDEDVEDAPKLTGLQRLSAKICDLVDDFNLVCFQPLDISDGHSVATLVRLLDKANGHPAGVYAPAHLIADATTLFLAPETPPAEAAPKLATALGNRQFRTHAAAAAVDDSPAPHHQQQLAEEQPPPPFSWYRRPPR
ncbi:hypothetical protein CTAYLR_006887 [Chrysophaeum taylorii]|uniref:GPN-loop GTPase 2 n=1 Tax=Chrysophaeum taylorii TaxID=2483200 RepID=A0AAD7XJR0_9STRA|nr:hypothetical protein CTAYLR_006887 [Chrysophaeum taylorii]